MTAAVAFTDPDALTPDALRDVWFSPRRRKPGYDETEVDEFLDLCSERIARLMRRVAELEAGGPDAPAPAPDETGLLTFAEHRAVEQLGDLWDLLSVAVVERGRNARDDLAEAAAHLHALQNMVLAQAAARAYPDRYRRLGASVGDERPDRPFALRGDGSLVAAPEDGR